MGQGDGQEKEGSAPSRAPLSYEKTPCCQSQHGQVRGDTSLGQDWGPQGPLMPDPQALRKQSQRFPDRGGGERSRQALWRMVVPALAQQPSRPLSLVAAPREAQISRL